LKILTRRIPGDGDLDERFPLGWQRRAEAGGWSVSGTDVSGVVAGDVAADEGGQWIVNERRVYGDVEPSAEVLGGVFPFGWKREITGRGWVVSGERLADGAEFKPDRGLTDRGNGLVEEVVSVMRQIAADWSPPANLGGLSLPGASTVSGAGAVVCTGISYAYQRARLLRVQCTYLHLPAGPLVFEVKVPWTKPGWMELASAGTVGESVAVSVKTFAPSRMVVAAKRTITYSVGGAPPVQPGAWRIQRPACLSYYFQDAQDNWHYETRTSPDYICDGSSAGLGEGTSFMGQPCQQGNVSLSSSPMAYPAVGAVLQSDVDWNVATDLRSGQRVSRVTVDVLDEMISG
jgi:hypothetical protein